MGQHDDLEFRAAVGDLAVASAGLEHSLHRAIVRAFNDRRVDLFLADMGLASLARHFKALYADAPGIDDLARDIGTCIQERNRYIHGEIVMSFNGPPGAPFWQLHDRKKGKHEPLPTGEEVRAAGAKTAAVSMQVGNLADTRDFDYNFEKLEAAFESYHGDDTE